MNVCNIYNAKVKQRKVLIKLIMHNFYVKLEKLFKTSQNRLFTQIIVLIM